MKWGDLEVLDEWHVARSDESVTFVDYHYPFAEEFYGVVIVLTDPEGTRYYHRVWVAGEWVPTHERNFKRKWLRDRTYRPQWQIPMEEMNAVLYGE